jgi:hypothetical protein
MNMNIWNNFLNENNYNCICVFHFQMINHVKFKVHALTRRDPLCCYAWLTRSLQNQGLSVVMSTVSPGKYYGQFINEVNCYGMYVSQYIPCVVVKIQSFLRPRLLRSYCMSLCLVMVYTSLILLCCFSKNVGTCSSIWIWTFETIS